MQTSLFCGIDENLGKIILNCLKPIVLAEYIFIVIFFQTFGFFVKLIEKKEETFRERTLRYLY